MNSWYKLHHPEIFQGTLTEKNYFEGWYFKIVDNESENVLAFIPTIAINKNSNIYMSFIQIFDGINLDVFIVEYPIETFKSSRSKFEIKIGPNYFSTNRIKLNIEREDIKIFGTLNFKNLTPLPKSFLFPGAMGIFTYLPFMETYHGIISMNHKINGKLIYQDTELNFKESSKGYIEKDWGKGFPKAWIWMQSNHFFENQRSFMLSIAKIPYLGINFIGFLCFVWDREKFYKFTTYSRANLKSLRATKKRVGIIIENSKNILIINAHAGDAAILKAPTLGLMTSRDEESMSAIIKLRLYRKTQDQALKLIFDDTGFNSGLEVMNPQDLK
ncbi:MAG: hypothetical protein GF317_01470 [Candidatus Lokiarchaeota archaeon]|nr:hypothetical protein [Candidatus Lokiarchaeota archaeon]MBD3198613.1 hypothetical protein [Candidatus Lokiarchaeota archaeon]